MNDPQQWWGTLTEDDRTLFLAHRDTSPLPAEVVQRAVDSGQPIAGARWVESSDGFAFNWPSWVQTFLRDKAAERDA